MFPRSLSLPAWVMAKLSPDYCHSLLLTMSDEEKRKFLRTLEERPLLPATSSEPTSTTPAGSGTTATDPRQSLQTSFLNPMGESLATEDYGDTTSTVVTSPAPRRNSHRLSRLRPRPPPSPHRSRYPRRPAIKPLLHRLWPRTQRMTQMEAPLRPLRLLLRGGQIRRPAATGRRSSLASDAPADRL